MAHSCYALLEGTFTPLIHPTAIRVISPNNDRDKISIDEGCKSLIKMENGRKEWEGEAQRQASTMLQGPSYLIFF